ncbi:L-cystine transporter [Parasalinivibrio latis]|uniref:L-cystine transporter n=1 Tax=Parasalinivibrio latis TaxID=2952610 RepID=UPI0030DE8EE3
MYTVFNLILFALLTLAVLRYHKRSESLSKSVFLGLAIGVVFGTALNLIYSNSSVVPDTLTYINVVGAGYVSLLKMIVMPLILVSIVSAITKVQNASSLGKISSLSIGILLGTTAVAALIGVFVTHIFGLSADSIVEGAKEIARGHSLEERAGALANLSIADMVLNFLPANPFADLAGARPTSTIAVVIFSTFIGLSGMTVNKTNPELGAAFIKFVQVAQAVIAAMVRKVLALTPYGVMALMTKVIATSDYDSILNLMNFVVGSYVGLGLIFLLHLALISLSGLNPVQYLKKVAPVLTFAFTSRSSAGTLPLNIDTQIKQLGNNEGVANFSASFGTTMGQNGCAGLYPAMLATMIAPTLGVNPMDPAFIATLVAVVTVSSFGIAGVGGGATFAAIIVLSTLGMPVALAGLLISIEPLIDMGRTAINVSGSMTSGTVTSKLLGMQDQTIYNDAEPNMVEAHS